MKPIQTSLTILAIALIPAIAVAQPAAGGGGGGYYGQPPVNTGGFHERAGTPMLGFSIGLGGMETEGGPVECANCEYSPIGVEFDGHVGGMLSNQFGLMLELQANAETVEDYGYEGNASLVQSTAMIAGQYFVSPRLWLKGGLGVAHLSYSYQDSYGGIDQPVDDGAAVMAAVGYELLSSRTFGLDVQARVIMAGYDGINDKITAATIGVGFNWYGFGHTGAIIRIH